jgi:endo-1,4-beta-mannosidase
MRISTPTSSWCVDDASRDTFRLGVNYWPAEAAMQWLQVYDPAATRRDFHRAGAAGFDTLRVFLRWEDVQPASSTVDSVVVGRLVDAADAAVEAGVTLLVTLFVGHMSGVNWIPAWATGTDAGDPRFRVISGTRTRPTTGLRNWYADPGIVDAQERVAAAVARALADHPGVWGWDLGNENSNCTVPPSRAAGEAWLERMATAIRRADPGRPLTIGIHMEDLEEDRRIGPAEAARWCDLVSMHGYPIYADWSAGKTDDQLLPFLAEVTSWMAGGAPILFEEFGLPTTGRALPDDGQLVAEADAASYVGRALDGLRAAGCVGAFVWCFTDYAPEFADLPPFDLAPHELSFGLWRPGGEPKPAVAQIAARSGAERLAPRDPGTWLDIDRAAFEADRRGQLERLYARFRGAADVSERAQSA